MICTHEISESLEKTYKYAKNPHVTKRRILVIEKKVKALMLRISEVAERTILNITRLSKTEISLILRLLMDYGI